MCCRLSEASGTPKSPKTSAGAGLPIPAPRGVIFDREGRVIVDSRPIYNVILSREDVKDKDLTSLIEPLAEGLSVDKDILREYFEVVKTMPAFESILVKQDATPGDIAWVEAHNLEYPELRVEQQPQRRYPANGSLAHVLGYVGEISPEQLKQQTLQRQRSQTRRHHRPKRYRADLRRLPARPRRLS